MYISLDECCTAHNACLFPSLIPIRQWFNLHGLGPAYCIFFLTPWAMSENVMNIQSIDLSNLICDDISLSRFGRDIYSFVSTQFVVIRRIKKPITNVTLSFFINLHIILMTKLIYDFDACPSFILLCYIHYYIVACVSFCIAVRKHNCLNWYGKQKAILFIVYL